MDRSGKHSRRKGVIMESVLVTNWEPVEKDDFYLSKAWGENGGKENVRRARKLQKEGNLFEAYIVPALSYVQYVQMDASQVFIDREGNEILSCESAIIGNKHETKWEYKY